MAGAHFLTPKPVPAKSPQKHFTLAQANATLPLVRRIVGDIVAAHAQVAQSQAMLEKSSGAEHTRVQAELAKGLEHLQDYVDELRDVGCELKDFKLGLIDFLGHHQSRTVCLCWKLGEDHVNFWHETDAGYTGRQPIATLEEAKSSGVAGDSVPRRSR